MIIIILSLLLVLSIIYIYRTNESYDNKKNSYNQNNNPKHNYVMCLHENRQYKKDLEPLEYSSEIFKVKINDDDEDKHDLHKKCRKNQFCAYTFQQGTMAMTGFKDSDIKKFFPKALTPIDNQHPNQECQLQFKNSNLVPYLFQSVKDLNNILTKYKNEIQQLDTKVSPLKTKLGILKECVKKIDKTNRCKILYQ